MVALYPVEVVSSPWCRTRGKPLVKSSVREVVGASAGNPSYLAPANTGAMRKVVVGALGLQKKSRGVGDPSYPTSENVECEKRLPRLVYGRAS